MVSVFDPAIPRSLAAPENVSVSIFQSALSVASLSELLALKIISAFPSLEGSPPVQLPGSLQFDVGKLVPFQVWPWESETAAK